MTPTVSAVKASVIHDNKSLPAKVLLQFTIQPEDQPNRLPQFWRYEIYGYSLSIYRKQWSLIYEKNFSNFIVINLALS